MNLGAVSAHISAADFVELIIQQTRDQCIVAADQRDAAQRISDIVASFAAQAHKGVDEFLSVVEVVAPAEADSFLAAITRLQTPITPITT